MRLKRNYLILIKKVGSDENFATGLKLKVLSFSYHELGTRFDGAFVMNSNRYKFGKFDVFRDVISANSTI